MTPPMHYSHERQSWILGPAPTTPATDTANFLAGLKDKDTAK